MDHSRLHHPGIQAPQTQFFPGFGVDEQDRVPAKPFQKQIATGVRPGGHLVLGPVELPLASRLALEWVGVYGASILRKPADAEPSRPRPG